VFGLGAPPEGLSNLNYSVILHSSSPAKKTSKVLGKRLTTNQDEDNFKMFPKSTNPKKKIFAQLQHCILTGFQALGVVSL